jgi:uncharacterized protein
MTMSLTYPGVYVQEVPSDVRTITGVATSITAFVGRTMRGPTEKPMVVQSFAEFVRLYGGLAVDCPLSYAVSHYFLNGGRDALICRAVHFTPPNNATKATVTLAPGLVLEAANEGQWGNKLRVRVEDAPPDTGDPADSRFNLRVKDTGTGQVENFLNLSTIPAHPKFVTNVLASRSDLVRTRGAVPNTRPTASGSVNPPDDPMDTNPGSTAFNNNGSDGAALVHADVGDVTQLEAQRRGLWLLELADLVNLICIPPLTRDGDVPKATWEGAVTYATKRRAIVLVDPNSTWAGPAAVLAALPNDVPKSENGALYYPMIHAPDPLRQNQIATFTPSGAVAGVIARTDATRGVWKAPAGLDATLVGVDALDYSLTDGENGQLNPHGVNCLRQFPTAGRVVWGARTLRGDDQLASEWKYLPVRRTALYIEESLFRGTQWVVFEPNDEPLWSQIRLNVGAFMHDLFRKGAFQGLTPKDAYLVKCDKETTTQTDINNGVVNIVVGFAPLKPAEFVVIQLQQLAGQIAT